MDNLTATVSPHGYPIARFTPAPLVISRRTVIVDAIIWDAEYGHYRAIGRYARKDGSAGLQVAKPLMFNAEVPSDVRSALEAVKAAT